MISTIIVKQKSTKENHTALNKAVTTLASRDRDAKALDELVTKLKNWHPGESSKPKVERKEPTFYVYKDPYKILKEQQEKSKRQQ